MNVVNRKGTFNDYVTLRKLVQNILGVNSTLSGEIIIKISPKNIEVKNLQSLNYSLNRKILDSADSRGIVSENQTAIIRVNIDLFKYNDMLAYKYIKGVDISRYTDDNLVEYVNGR